MCGGDSLKNKLTSIFMCVVLALCIFLSYGFTICSVCVIDDRGEVIKSYYSSSDITTALSRALDYTKNYASKYNPLTVKISRGNYNVKNTIFLTSFTTVDLNGAYIKNANFNRGNIFKSPEDKAYPRYSSLCECIIKNGTLDDNFNRNRSCILRLCHAKNI